MADLKISALTAAGSVDPDDLLASVDVSDTTMNASGTTKKTTRELLQTYNAGTLTTDKKVLDLSATWNAAGVTFTGVKFNVTNTASASGSKVFDFQIGGSTQLALTATGLGVGAASPSAPLAFGKAVYAAPTSEDWFRIKFRDTGGIANDVGIGQSGAANLEFNAGGDGGGFIWYGGTAGERMRLDSSGNLGLGVTPSAWAATSRALDFTYPSVGMDTTGAAVFGFNAYNSSGTTWNYKTTDEAALFTITNGGAFTWRQAVSGTAGNTISFTQAMTLDASGNLGVGITSPSYRLDVSGQARFSNTIFSTVTGSTAALDLSVGTAAGRAVHIGTTGSDAYIGTASSTGGTLVTGSPAYALELRNDTGFVFGTGSSFALGIKAGGFMQFAGTTSSFPALKRSSTTLQVRLADDSGDAPFSSGKATIQTLTVGLGGQTAVSTNTAVGVSALDSASLTGGSNVAVGHQALLSNTTGSSNCAFGTSALTNNSTGNLNAAVGGAALRYFNTSNNVAVGFEAVRGSTTVANNTGDSLVGVGYRALYSNTSGLQNSAVGGEALLNNTTGQFNAAFGYGALTNNTTASNNSAVGRLALLYFNTSNNVAVGYEAVRGSTTVANNTGTSLVGVGYQALQNNTSGTQNTAVGYQALVNNTTGSYNGAIGHLALAQNTTGGRNVAFGLEALGKNSTGERNVALGMWSLLYFNTSNNVAVGHGALLGGSTTVANNTGANNIAIGYAAGDAITTGSNNIVIGHDIDPDSATGSSQINIGDRYFHDRIRLLERTSDPAKPAEGNMIVWMSNGTGLGDDGDVIIASTAGGVTNYAILFDHSAGTVWP